jgi:hypothetical protein
MPENEKELRDVERDEVHQVAGEAPGNPQHMIWIQPAKQTRRKDAVSFRRSLYSPMVVAAATRATLLLYLCTGRTGRRAKL